MLAQQLLNGILLGSMYALLAISFTLVLGVLNMLNLAQGEILTAGALVAYSVMRATGNLPLALLLAVVTAVVLSVVVEYFCFHLPRGDTQVVTTIAMGMLLEEIPVAGGTADMEPNLDYIVAKFPRFPFDKFASAPNTLGTQMKATGEVMGIGSNLEECLLKSVRSLEIGACHFHLPKFDDMTEAELRDYILEFKDDNIFAVTELLRRGVVRQEHIVTILKNQIIK